MLIKLTRFKNLLVIYKKPFKDKRGFFVRDFCSNELKKLNFRIKQVNISYNKKKYTLRGFHYQNKPYAESKIISCISGEIFNVCIDLRKKSDTYLKIFKKRLSDKVYQSLHVPAGFANAYLTLKHRNVFCKKEDLLNSFSQLCLHLDKCKFYFSQILLNL